MGRGQQGAEELLYGKVRLRPNHQRVLTRFARFNDAINVAWEGDTSDPTSELYDELLRRAQEALQSVEVKPAEIKPGPLLSDSETSTILVTEDGEEIYSRWRDLTLAGSKIAHLMGSSDNRGLELWPAPFLRFGADDEGELTSVRIADGDPAELIDDPRHLETARGILLERIQRRRREGIEGDLEGE